jgi:uncharacterized protein (DUF2252 family)
MLRMQANSNAEVETMATSEQEETTDNRTAPRKVEHFTPAERAARGKAARAEVPRRSHGEWEPPTQRADPVELLQEQAASRVPELVPIRYGRMMVSPFTFYRGAAYLMASDLSHGARTGLHAQLCGDAHLSNFGVYAAPDRRLVFSVNDFDETLPGPFEWDVKRLVTSFEVASRDRGFDAKTRRKINMAVSASYRAGMQAYGEMRNLDVWYDRIDVDEVIKQFQAAANVEQRKRMDKNLAKARTKDSLAAFNKLTEVVDGERRIVSNPPLIVPIDELAGPDAPAVREGIQNLIRGYRRTLAGDRRRLLERYRFVDMARKVVGVGSVGTRAWIILMLGRDGDDPLFLQAKEAQPSVLEPFIGRSEFGNHGQRVVEGQRLMQSASDIFLGWIHTDRGIDGQPRDFYMRQLWDAKGSALVDVMEADAMEMYGKLCGRTLAKGHARSGDAIAIASYLGTSDIFDQAIAQFADTYADQNERDYKTLEEAIASGAITAETGL